MSSELSCSFYFPCYFIGSEAQTHVTVRNSKERSVPLLNTGKYPGWSQILHFLSTKKHTTEAYICAFYYFIHLLVSIVQPSNCVKSLEYSLMNELLSFREV